MSSLTTFRCRLVTAASRKRDGLRPIDGPLLAAVVLLLGLGLILVYSSSAIYALRTYGDAEHFIRRQAIWALLGMAVLYGAYRVDVTWLYRRAGWVLLASMLLCVLVLIPGIGHQAGGARRWLVMGSLGFQPSELAKLAVVIVLAALLARRDGAPKENRGGLLGPVLMMQLPVLLLLLEPDLGTALVIELIVAAMVFAAGLRVQTLLLLGLAALPVFYHLVVGTPFRLQRLLSYIDPWAYRSTVGYQVTEALISIGSGGTWGVGLGAGKQKLFFLPEAHTDFIFAILAEELGFVGVLVLLFAYAVLLWRAIRIAIDAPTTFGAYLALGLAALIGVPAVFNTCVATGLLPTKGLPLPLLSSGGSNLVVTLTAVGLLLRVGADVQATASPSKSPKSSQRANKREAAA